MPCFAFCFHKIQETSKSCTLGEYSPYSCVNRLPRCCSAGVGPFAAEPPSCRPLCDKTPLTAKAAAQRR